MRVSVAAGLLTALAFALTLGFTGGVVAADTPATAVNATVNGTDGETTTVDIVVQDASDGVGALDANVSLDGPGTITSLELAGDPGLDDAHIEGDGRNATLYAAWLDSPLPAGEDVTVATLTVADADDTTVLLGIGALGSANGVEYDVTASSDATLGSSTSTPLVVVDRNISPKSGAAPLSVTARATVTNPGEEPTNGTVGFRLDGDTVEERTLTLDAEENRTVFFDRELGVGEHAVSVAGSDPVTVNVSERVEPNTPPSAELSYPADVISNATVTLDAGRSTDPDGDNLTYRWDTDDDGVFDDGTGETLRATFANGEQTVRVNVSDEHGGYATASARFTVDTMAPTVNVESRTAAAGSTPEGEPATISRNLTLTGSVDDRTETRTAVVLNAIGTNYEQRFPVINGSQPGTFEVNIEADALASTGAYNMTVVAIDAAGNVERIDASRVIVDRNTPRLSATVAATGPTTGQIRVYSDEALRNAPAVTVTRPNGETTSVSLSAADGTRTWTGSLSLAAVGTYEVSVRGTDMAGNVGIATAATTVRTDIDTADGITTLSGSNGTFVRMTTDGPVEDAYAALTAQSNPTGDLPPSLTGVSFLTGELSETLDAGLTNATVGIPVRALPDNVSPSEAEIRYFDAVNGSWDTVETAVENQTIGDETRRYWTAEVTHFSTYGVVIPDTTPPSAISALEPNRTLAYGADSVPFRVTYADAASGVNDSAVRLALDGPGTEGWTDVTSVPNASVTEAFATFNKSDPAPGQYSFRVSVADAAGNRVNVTQSALVKDDTQAPQLTSQIPTNGTALNTTNTTLSMSFTDTKSGIASLTTYLDGNAVDANVTDGAVVHDVTNLSDGDHVFAVVVTDAAGNERRYESAFTVAEGSDSANESDDSGGGVSAPGGFPAGGGGFPAGGSDDETRDEPQDNETENETGSPTRIEHENRDGLHVIRIQSPDADELLRLNVSMESSSTETDTAITQLEVKQAMNASQLDLYVHSPTDSPTMDVPPVDATALSYVEMDAKNVTSDHIEHAVTYFDLGSERLPDTVDPSQVTVYRYHDGSWSALPTDHAGDATFRARTPGFSQFAIGFEEVTTTPTPTTSSTTTIQPETTTRVTPTTTANPVSTTSDSSTTSSDETTTEQPDTTVGPGTPGFGVAITLLALFAAATLALRREN